MSNESIKFNDCVQNLHSDKMRELKKILPNLFDKDGNLIKAELENFAGQYEGEKQEPFCFSWAGKQKAKSLAFKQSETKLALKFDEKRGKNTDTTENLIIEGDNLHVLKLLVPSYKARVKCIYIDPPYNTQNEFIYPDNYASSEIDYLVESGQIEEGQDVSGQNRQEKNTGRKHSNWLSFMYPRLVLARELLREDGVIFISIDDNEVHHLRQIMNEIFGEGEFVACLIWKKTENIKMDSKFFSINKDYILCYKKNDLECLNKELSDIERYNLEDEKGKYYLRKLDSKSSSYSKSLDYIIEYNGLKYYAGGDYEKYLKRQEYGGNNKDAIWLWSRKTFEEGLRNNEIVFKNGNVYNKVRFDGIAKKPYTDFVDVHSGQQATVELNELFNGDRIFDHPKPVSLIKHLLQISTAPSDLILDFFAGSGTTGQAVMELNQEELDKAAKDGLLADKTTEVGGRKFILVQLPEKIDEKKEAFKAGYKHISDITIERVKRAGEKYKSVDNGFKVLSVTESAIDRKFMNVINATKEEIFAEIALQFGYGLNFVVKNLFNEVFKLTGNEKQAMVILENEQLTNEMQKQIIGKSDELAECQIFAQDACLNVEIIHNLYQHFEQKRVVIL